MGFAVCIRCLGLLLCLMLSGCAVCGSAFRINVREPGEFSWKRDKARSIKVYREWAERAWSEQPMACARPAPHPDYQHGFLVGFADYVYLGGNCEPPPVPPRRFWNTDMRTPRGKECADQWFAGFRHGAQVARDGGYRELATVRTSFYEAGFTGSTEESEPGPHFFENEHEHWTGEEGRQMHVMPSSPPVEMLPEPSEHREEVDEGDDPNGLPVLPSTMQKPTLPPPVLAAPTKAPKPDFQAARVKTMNGRWARHQSELQFEP